MRDYLKTIERHTHLFMLMVAEDAKDMLKSDGFTEEEKKHYFIKFNVDGLLRGDYQSRMNGYATARQNGWMSANDIRELENLDRIPKEDGGDLYLVNGNMLPLENITKHNAYFNEDTQKKEQNEDEEILELDEPNGQSEGERQDAFSERNNRRRKLV